MRSTAEKRKSAWNPNGQHRPMLSSYFVGNLVAVDYLDYYDDTITHVEMDLEAASVFLTQLQTALVDVVKHAGYNRA